MSVWPNRGLATRKSLVACGTRLSLLRLRVIRSLSAYAMPLMACQEKGQFTKEQEKSGVCRPAAAWRSWCNSVAHGRDDEAPANLHREEKRRGHRHLSPVAPHRCAKLRPGNWYNSLHRI